MVLQTLGPNLVGKHEVTTKRTCPNGHVNCGEDKQSQNTAINVSAIHLSLENALGEFLVPFPQPSWKCPNCQYLGDVVVEQNVIIPGDVMVISVTHPPSGGLAFKVPRDFEFASGKWKVTAVAEHRPGHWVAHIRTISEGNIFCVNDSHAIRHPDDEFPSVHACLIMAQRNDPLPNMPYLPPLTGLGFEIPPLPFALPTIEPLTTTNEAERTDIVVSMD